VSSTHDLSLNHHTSAEAIKLLDKLCEAYADAYGTVPDEDIREKSSAFRERARAAPQGLNYSLVTAHVGDQLVGWLVGWFHLRLQLAARAGMVGRPAARATGGLRRGVGAPETPRRVDRQDNLAWDVHGPAATPAVPGRIVSCRGLVGDREVRVERHVVESQQLGCGLAFGAQGWARHGDHREGAQGTVSLQDTP
jgi:hypothetical protein